ncbi:hypothetical protein MSU25_000137 [Salmonella enterica]|uniref:Uncharacterized protein n=2 Tax=Salmonella enterica TaxID=28901 RepID=A0A633DL65_SALER|nr:hypothetical protein [Salmonella enterica]EAS0615867.1 hypothetical protein [Salmonella enterica subsp. enterica serovar Dahomey]EBA1163897.1 hypothetical protein [Salmonella enterica subsp. enterica]EBF8621896.1 hypothetical protein [Salmonella enterica subsp. enterica serovar Istanbul]EBQ9004700.1 hypothetical protein [Salmonella enterica subsp. enterica serovar Blockley]EBQ9480298.1 hypothetical protein [Salmonella enterica subsp. enterica serovar Kokomlemle]EBV8414123.1 hypothetical pr
MATKRVALTRDWYQLSDGSHDVTIQFKDSVAVCRSKAKPDENMDGLNFTDTILTFTRPDVVWIRSYGLHRTAEIVIW